MINRALADNANAQPDIQRLIRAQLETVKDLLDNYLTTGAQLCDDSTIIEEPWWMPHQWGSMDSLDDMRNSLYLAEAMLDQLALGDIPFDDFKKNREELASPCATHPDVLTALGYNHDTDEWED